MPPFKLVTGKLPVTLDVRLTEFNVANVPKPRLVLAEAADVAPVPPAVIGSVPVVNAEVEVAYTAPSVVKLVSPVPP